MTKNPEPSTLAYAIMEMTIRYGTAERREAYAWERGTFSGKTPEQWSRLADIRRKAVGRLTIALMNQAYAKNS